MLFAIAAVLAWGCGDDTTVSAAPVPVDAKSQTEVSGDVGAVPEDSAVDAVGSAVDGVGRAVDGVGRAVDAVGSAVDAVGRAVDAVGRAVDAVGRAVDAGVEDAGNPQDAQLDGQEPDGGDPDQQAAADDAAPDVTPVADAATADLETPPDTPSDTDPVVDAVVDSGGPGPDTATDGPADANAETVVDTVADAGPEVAQDTGPEITGACSSDASCNDNNQCTDDKCQSDGACLWNLKKGLCDDGNPCTTGEACDFLQCKGGTAMDPKVGCNDANSCTVDSCNTVKGCQHANAAAACDDGNLCTVGEKCEGGACKTATGGLNACDDGKPCTTDQCDLKTGACLWFAVTGACEDGDLCTVGDTCTSNKCVAGPAKSCADTNPCTQDACDAKTGKCTFASSAAAAAQVCDATLAGGRCIKAFKTNQTFAAAEVECVKWGGHLVHVKSAEDNTLVRGVANAVCGSGTQALIGLADTAVEGKYVWTNGSPMTFANWSGGQPDNCTNCCSLAGQGEDIVHLMPDGKWNDLCAATALPCYVCDRPVPSVACGDSTNCMSGGLCTAGVCAATGGGPAGCDDANPCTTDACVSGGNCTFSAVKDGVACGSGGTCVKGKCGVGADPSNPATSCAALAAATPSFKSTLAWIDPDGKAGSKVSTQTLCDPATSGAAWTLLAVVSDDGQATWTWNAKDLWGNGQQSVGAPNALSKDFRSPLLGSMPVAEVMFVHATGLWASYPLGKGAQSLGGVIVATGGPICYAKGGPGIKQAAGTLIKADKLCDTDLYLNPDDHDNNTGCTGDNDPESAWGPAWNVNREAGCFDDPGWAGGLGPVKSEPATEGGTAQPVAVGFGWALSLNKGTAGSGQNWMRVYGR
ncbi:MAG: hypothetical protein EXR77_14400 [Myxococcales bacterium]|nr:hypothetical protein [Myxococcales bacterium]